MSAFDLLVRAVHVVCASLWVGATFFIAWFLIPALGDSGADGGKVMAAVQKRGWIAVVPVIATLTVLSGLWLYQPYVGNDGNAARLLGLGGVLGFVAFGIGIGFVRPAMDKATKLITSTQTMTAGAERDAAMAKAAALRQRGLTLTRVVSLILILAAILMTIAMYV